MYYTCTLAPDAAQNFPSAKIEFQSRTEYVRTKWRVWVDTLEPISIHLRLPKTKEKKKKQIASEDLFSLPYVLPYAAAAVAAAAKCGTNYAPRAELRNPKLSFIASVHVFFFLSTIFPTKQYDTYGKNRTRV